MKKNVIINTLVNNVGKEDTERQTAELTMPKDVKYGMTPKYLCHNLWDPTTDSTHCTSDWTETASPLIQPPPSEFENQF